MPRIRNTTDQKLVGASNSTRLLLQRLCEQLPDLNYTESKNWATFRTGTAGPVAQLNPSHARIRLFLVLDHSTQSDLKPGPSTGTWGARFPSIFEIERPEDLARAGQLIRMSADAAAPRIKRSFTRRADQIAAEEVPDGTLYQEGAVHQVTVNAYERNPEAREACLRRYGRSCVICGFNFFEAYGEEAADYIQVHHIKPIARAGGSYVLNPLKDLRPVCPNCHAVIHRRDPPFSIAEVKRMLHTSPKQRRTGSQHP